MLKKCPAADELRAFAVGEMVGEQFETVASHVSGCAACEASLAGLDDLSDDIVSGLNQLPDRDAAEQIRVPENILMAARSVIGSCNEETKTPFAGDIDPGRAYAQRLKDGPVRLGRFELRGELGDGSFGYVFRARDLELDRDVAVKIGRAGSLANDEEIHAFLREARAAARLSHPNIVSIHDSGQTDDGVCFLVSELVEGETLEVHLERDPYLPGKAAELVSELAEALSYAHGQDVIHRDIKPSNIIVDAGGHPHLTDFGLAKRMMADQSMTADGKIMGTPAYMSPEQARGDSSAVDVRSDVYSLGVLLYELMTGERPFQGRRRLVMLQVLEDEPRPPRSLSDGIPRDLETICLKAMAKSPARRYASAGELGADLRRFLNGDPIEARPVGRIERLWRWCRKYPLAASVMVAVVAGSAVGFAHLSYLSAWFVRETALDSARMEADMLERINLYYSEEVVGRLDRDKIKVTHEYAQMKNALPLPATFTIDAGDRISAGDAGMQVRLYSDFPWRDDGGPKNDFERTALEKLKAGATRDVPQLDYYEFPSGSDGPVVQYARAQLMQESCRDCHNGDEQSPKRDWQIGDVAGVLAITRPLDRDIERTRSGLRGAFALVAGTAVFMVALSFLLFPRRNR